VNAIAQKRVICAYCDLEGGHSRTTHTRRSARTWAQRPANSITASDAGPAGMAAAGGLGYHASALTGTSLHQTPQSQRIPPFLTRNLTRR
jgi:hypothetical protein